MMVPTLPRFQGPTWDLDPYLFEQLHIEGLLEDALGRLKDRGTWKVSQNCKGIRTKQHDLVCGFELVCGPTCQGLALPSRQEGF